MTYFGGGFLNICLFNNIMQDLFKVIRIFSDVFQLISENIPKIFSNEHSLKVPMWLLLSH
jgi:hypothetical protein